MKKYKSFIGIVELSEERKNHIFISHPELKCHLPKFQQVLQKPDAVRKSKYDPHVLLFYKYFVSIKGGKHLMIAVKIGDRNFILTAYFTDKIRAGTVYETEKKSN